MSISLYDLSVPTFLQTVRALGNVLDRASAHCAKAGADPDAFVEACLRDDMAPFHFQIEAAWHHAVWGVETAKTGAFTPPSLIGPQPFADLRGILKTAESSLEAFAPEEVNSWSGKTMDIEVYQPVNPDNASTSAWAPQTLAFTPETFLLSYSLPNFYFHAVTAYDILRVQGVPIGKGDYQGRLRTRST